MDEIDITELKTLERELYTAHEPPAFRSLLVYRICAVSHRLRNLAVDEVLTNHGLDLRDWLVLAALYEMGSATQRQVAQFIHLDKVAVNRAAARLKDRDLICSHPNVRDGRSHLLSASARGRDVVSSCTQALMTMEQAIFNRLSEKESNKFVELLDSVAGGVAFLEQASPSVPPVNSEFQ